MLRFTCLCSSMLPSPETHHHSPVPLHKALHFHIFQAKLAKGSKKKIQLARTWCNLSMIEHWADPQLCISHIVTHIVQCNVSRWVWACHSPPHTVQCSVMWWVWARHSSACIHSAVQGDAVGMSLCSQHRIHTQETLQKYTVVCNSRFKNSA